MDFLIRAPGLDCSNKRATCALCMDEEVGFHGWLTASFSSVMSHLPLFQLLWVPDWLTSPWTLASTQSVSWKCTQPWSLSIYSTNNFPNHSISLPFTFFHCHSLYQKTVLIPSLLPKHKGKIHFEQKWGKLIKFYMKAPTMSIMRRQHYITVYQYGVKLWRGSKSQ